MHAAHTPTQNRLLAALPAAEYGWLRPNPVCVMHDGSLAQIAIVGRLS